MEAEAANREGLWEAQLQSLDDRLKADVIEAERLQAAEALRVAEEANDAAVEDGFAAAEAAAELERLQQDISEQLT